MCPLLTKAKFFGTWSSTVHSKRYKRWVTVFIWTRVLAFVVFCKLALTSSASFVFPNSASMCHILPLPCLLAPTRRRGIQPQRTVSFCFIQYFVIWHICNCNSTFACLTVSCFISGMTVEVLGTLIGTAVQGQIVGMANAPCIQTREDLNSTAGLEVNTTESHGTLEHLVCIFFFTRFIELLLLLRWCLMFGFDCPTEKCLHDFIWCHLLHLRSLCRGAVPWCERAKRYASNIGKLSGYINEAQTGLLCFC